MGLLTNVHFIMSAGCLLFLCLIICYLCWRSKAKKKLTHGAVKNRAQQGRDAIVKNKEQNKTNKTRADHTSKRARRSPVKE